jgi:ABC-type lipoprotein release transport system permease subunit
LRAWFRGRRALVVVTVVLVGVVAGLALGLVAGARRTASAPDRYTTSSGGDPDLLVQQQAGDPLIAAVAAMPGVRSATGLTFVTAFLRGPDGSLVFRPNPFSGDDRFGGARVVEGRHTDSHASAEFTVNPSMATLLRRRFVSQLGDRFDVAAFSREQVESNRAFGTGDRPEVPPFSVRWVGVVDDPANFEDDSPAIYYSQKFLDTHPDVGVVQSLIEVHLTGATDRRAIMHAVRQLAGGADAYAIPSRIVSDASRRAVRFQATALWIVSGIIALGSVILVMLLVSRVVRRPASEVRALASLGLRGRDLMVERVCEALCCAGAAAAVSLVVVSVVSERFPLGALRVFEPHPGRHVDWVVVGLGAFVLLAVAAAAAVLTAPRGQDGATVATRSRPLLAARGGVPFVLGAHFARVGPTGRRRSLVSLLAGVVGVVVLVAAIVVGLSVDTMVNTSSRWGVNYDGLLGNPYVETNTDIVAPVARTPGVLRLTAAHIGSLSIDGSQTSTLAIDPIKGALLPEVLHGRAPRRGAEIGLGAEVADQLGVGVGDTVRLGGSNSATRRARVVGIVVTPDSAGGGAAVPFALYQSLNPTATRNVLFADFGAGAQDRVIERLRAENFSPPDALPVPSSIEALRRVLPAPVVLAVAVSVLLLVGCAFLLTLSVRAQQRDFAILRALGAKRRQVRSVVHWEATLTVLAILVVSAPLGIALGRLIVRQITGRLGIVPGIDVPLLALLVGTVGFLLAANVLATVPARRAARQRAALLARD